MKKIITLIVAFSSFGCTFAQSTTEPTDDSVPFDVVLDLEYQLRSFKDAKYSGSYGFGVNKTSFDNNRSKKFHIGADFHMNINAGIVDNFSMIYELGPSFRYDVSNNCFINTPLNIICYVGSHEEGNERKTDVTWGLRLAPSLYYFFSKRVGIFAGPQLWVPFVKNTDVEFGLQTGVAISF